jgi:hypothetical protein
VVVRGCANRSPLLWPLKKNTMQDNHEQVGWIKLNRDIQNHFIFQDPNKLKMFILLLLNVNYMEGSFILGNKVYKVKPGESAKSLRSWAIIFNCSVKATTNFFKLLSENDMIDINIIGKGKHSTTIVRVRYNNCFNNDEETLTTTLTTTLGYTQEAHNIRREEGNKEKKKEVEKKPTKKREPAKKELQPYEQPKDPNTELTPLQVTINEFIDHRKQIKAALTPLAYKKIINELNDLAPNNAPEQIKMLNQSIMNGWKGVFKIKSQTGANNTTNNNAAAYTQRRG